MNSNRAVSALSNNSRRSDSPLISHPTRSIILCGRKTDPISWSVNRCDPAIVNHDDIARHCVSVEYCAILVSLFGPLQTM